MPDHPIPTLTQNTAHLSPLEDLLETIEYRGEQWWSPFLTWLQEQLLIRDREGHYATAFAAFQWSRRRAAVWNAFHEAGAARRELFSWVLAYNVGPAEEVEDLAKERKRYIHKIIEFAEQARGHYLSIIQTVEEALRFLNEVLQMPATAEQEAFENRLQVEVRKPIAELEEMLQQCEKLYENLP